MFQQLSNGFFLPLLAASQTNISGHFLHDELGLGLSCPFNDPDEILKKFNTVLSSTHFRCSLPVWSMEGMTFLLKVTCIRMMQACAGKPLLHMLNGTPTKAKRPILR